MYGWRVIKRQLTDEERNKGIVYKSQVNQGENIGTIYEVNKNEPGWRKKLWKLKRNRTLKKIAKMYDFLVTEIIWI